MKDRFEKLREKLDDAIDKYGLNSSKTIKLSNRFNELINFYYKNEVQFSKDSILYIKYIESIKMLKKITLNFSKFPTIEEWNKYAKEKDLLCSESLKYITGINWHNLRNRIMSEI